MIRFGFNLDFWKFSPKVKRCSQFIDLKGFLIASRNDVGGKNPSVRTKQSFSPSRFKYHLPN